MLICAAEGWEDAAIWIAMHCLHCGTSALWRTKKYFAFKISVGSLEKLAAVAEQYALTHLDKPLKSYDFLKTVLP